MRITIPNVLSIIRIILSVVFCIIYFRPGMLIAALAVIVLSGITDLLDGYIARKYNQISELGKILDPISDKLFQVSTVICFVVSGAVPYWAVIVVVIKELVMLIGALVYYNHSEVVIAAKWYGKLASTLFFISFLVVFFFQIMENSLDLSPFAHTVINISFLVTLAVSLFATVNYIVLAGRTYFKNKNDKSCEIEKTNEIEKEQKTEE